MIMADFSSEREKDISDKILKLQQKLSSKGVSNPSVKQDLSRAFNERGFYHYHQMVDFYPAIQDYSQSIALDPTFEIAFYNRGLVRYRLGMYSDSKKDLEQCLEINSAFLEAKFALTQVLEDIEEGRSFGQ